MTHAAQVIACARALLGVPFRHQGRHARDGLDCLGLLIVAADAAGLRFGDRPASALDERHYGWRPDVHHLREKLEQNLQPIENMQVGDVLLLNIAGRAQHLALVSDYPQQNEFGIIHAYAMAGKVVEHRLDAPWRQAMVQIYRLPGPH